ncbi:hypothetical protein HKX48_004564 [Thoreauomyces humboldtii]|nr:hypothetical protein HKX48_004564 [Thoreauomyces humboldtii]
MADATATPRITPKVTKHWGGKTDVTVVTTPKAPPSPQITAASSAPTKSTVPSKSSRSTPSAPSKPSTGKNSVKPTTKPSVKAVVDAIPTPKSRNTTHPPVRSDSTPSHDPSEKRKPVSAKRALTQDADSVTTGEENGKKKRKRAGAGPAKDVVGDGNGSGKPVHESTEAPVDPPPQNRQSARLTEVAAAKATITAAAVAAAASGDEQTKASTKVAKQATAKAATNKAKVTSDPARKHQLMPKSESGVSPDVEQPATALPGEPRKVTLEDALRILPRMSLIRLIRYAVVEKAGLGAQEIADELQCTGVLDHPPDPAKM